MVWIKCRVRFRHRVRFWLRVLVRGRVRSQEAPGAEPKAVQLSPLRVELRAHGRMPFRFSLSVPIPDNCMGHWSCRPHQSFRAAAAGPEKRHAEVPGSIPCDPVLFLDPRRVVFSDFVIGCPWIRALARVRFSSRDVDRAETTTLL